MKKTPLFEFDVLERAFEREVERASHDEYEERIRLKIRFGEMKLYVIDRNVFSLFLIFECAVVTPKVTPMFLQSSTSI